MILNLISVPHVGTHCRYFCEIGRNTDDIELHYVEFWGLLRQFIHT